MTSPIQQVIGTAASGASSARPHAVTPAENLTQQNPDPQAARLVSQAVAQKATTRVGNGDQDGVQIPKRSERSFADRNQEDKEDEKATAKEKTTRQMPGQRNLDLTV